MRAIFLSRLMPTQKWTLETGNWKLEKKKHHRLDLAVDNDH
jgi:hypothetical protein